VRKRSALFLGWFGALFVFNIVVHHSSIASRQLIDGFAVGVAYMTSPEELLLSILAVILIVNLKPKISNNPVGAEPKKPTPK
jgi:hypothetical protein